jgi:hypothetical protein
MSLNKNLIVAGFIIAIYLLGCSSSVNLSTPEKIGVKERIRVITGKQAARVVNKMHGQSVATEANVIAEYGRDKKDLLYISYYVDQGQAEEAFNLMIEKMAAAQKGPFFHLMPLGKYENNVYFTLGMGAKHFIYRSGRYLLWLQTDQSFGDRLPQHLLALYPV